MRLPAICLLLAGSLHAQTFGGKVTLRDVEIVDARGVLTRVTSFRPVSSDEVFRGYRGAGRIEVPYERLREFRIQAPVSAGERKRIRLVPREGQAIDAEFDEHEGDLLFTGESHFGRITIFFGDIRRLTVLGKTDLKTLPRDEGEHFGLDARIRDRKNVVTELTGFRRLAGTDHVRGLRGSMTISIPMRRLRRLVIAPDERSGMLAGTATLRSGRYVAFRLPTYEERTLFGGSSELGSYRVSLGDVREVTVLRPTPGPPPSKGTEQDKKGSKSSPIDRPGRSDVRRSGQGGQPKR